MARNDGSHSIDSETGDDRPSPPRQHAPADQQDRTDHPARAGQYSMPYINTSDTRPTKPVEVEEQRVLPAKTSTAAVFALVFGLSAFLAVFTIVLSPLALVLSIIGIILAVMGIRMAKRVGVTGRGVAIGGLVLSVLALILSITIAAGVTTVLNNKTAVDRINKQVTKLENNLPKNATIPAT